MLSAGGAGCGSAWTSVPIRTEWRMVNSEFAMATQQRLGAARREPCSITCQIKSSDGAACGALLDDRMHHADVCPHGYIRVHKALVAAVVNEAVRAGAVTDVERYVPELMRVKVDGAIEDAKMDAVISWPASGSRILVDVSVRSAASSRYQRCGASQRGGVAAQQGGREKEARYGQAVWPCILEARGRLSQGGRAVLQRLVLDSKTYGRRTPGRAPGMCPRALRTTVEFAVLRAVADRALRAQNAARQSSSSTAQRDQDWL